MIICQGCGTGFDPPAGYTRSKIQCPGCGVICTVSGEGGRAAKSRSRPEASVPAEETALESLLADEKEASAAIPLFEEESSTMSRPAAAASSTEGKAGTITCRRCGKKIRRQRECPVCDVPESPRGMPDLELDALSRDDDDEEDASPYEMADKDVRACPHCRAELMPGAVLCMRCGLDLRTRKKVKRTYEPMARSWDTDMSLEMRLVWFGVGQGVHWVLALLSGVSGGPVLGFVIGWPFLTLLLTFVLGTFERLQMTRDRKGRVRVVKRWRFCFVPIAPETVEVRGYEGITTGQWQDVGMLEWFVFLSLLCMGILPGLIYWYQAIHKATYHVALALDHGHPEVYLYRGRSDEQMNDIADTLHQVSGLPRLA